MLDDPYGDKQEVVGVKQLPAWVVRLALVVAIGLGLILVAATAQAEPIYVASQGGIKITLYNDKCELSEVSNLPLKATWEEGGKLYQGCFALNPQMGVVAAYFREDRSVAVIPSNVFQRVTGV